MHRKYAGMLGLLAFATVIVRGWLSGHTPQSILLWAWWSLLVFTALGWIIGWLAARTVDEAVHAYVLDQSASSDPSHRGKATDRDRAPH